MTLWASWLWVGCAPPGSSPTEGPNPVLPDPSTDTGLQACAVPLGLDPPEVTVGPLSLVQLLPSGGTGAYQFALTDPAHGHVNASYGSYLAPDEEGLVDTIVLTDAGCLGEAIATVTVGDPFAVRPATAAVLPGTAFVLEVSGGSGEFACSAVELHSGGHVSSACAYAAGALEGLDHLRVVDPLTGSTIDVTITVDAEAALGVWGHERWALPLGSAFEPRIVGGSHVYDLSVLSGGVRTTGSTVLADAVGRARVRVTDRFAGFVAEVVVDVIAPQVPESAWFGQRALQGFALGPGDLDGDGFPDAVLSQVETNGQAWYSGAVAVHAGTATGLDPDPVWVALGASAQEFLGRSIDVADVNGDGHLDLIAGADAGDLSSSSIGLVRIWHGVAGGFFEPEPATVLRGVNGGDRAGSSLAACDFDGDGYTDLAVGAYGHEERTQDDHPLTTGAVLLFRGSAGGLPDAPSVIRYGRRIDASTGQWITPSSTRLGQLGMAAGDLDGDGDCELAVAAVEGVFGEPESYGWIAVYDGLPSSEGTLSAEPIRIVANTTDSNAGLARSIAIGDVDHDGRGDLVTGAYAWDGPAGANAGGVFVFLASSVDARAPTTPYTLNEADWFATGSAGGNYLGLYVRADDVDDDGFADVMAGEPRGERAGDAANVGRVRIWSGAAIAAGGTGHDGSGDVPLVDVGGTETEGYFGQAAAPVGDLDGDAAIDLVVLAGRTDRYGVDVGSPYFAPGSGGVPVDLEWPGEAAGHHHGRGMTLFDADGDGDRDLIIGSPDDGHVPTSGLYTGATSWFRNTGGSLDPVGTRFGDTFSGQGSYDRRGYALSGSSDFDGDGLDDLAVVSFSDASPNTFGSDYANPDACPGGLAGAGSVVIHLGSASGVSETPAFVFYGIDANAQMQVVASGFDMNGDGLDDVAVGGRNWGDSGGAAVLYGRPASPSGITVICDALVWEGVGTSTWFGSSLAALGDVDGDGCDEIAAGAPLEDTDVTNQGVVRVFWGSGASCNAGTPQFTAIGPGLVNSLAGDALAGGGDVDGDGIPDLAVGGTRVRLQSSELGAAWIVPGAYLAGLPRQSADPGLPDSADTVVHPLVPSGGVYGVLGSTPSGHFGGSVALVDDPRRPGQMALAVGIPDGAEGGVPFSGGVHLYRFDPVLPGIEPLPFMVVGGETHVPGGHLGEGIWRGNLSGTPVLLVGAPDSSQQGLSVGAGYVVELR